MKDISMTSTPFQSKPVVRWLALACWILFASLYLVLFIFDVVRDYADILIICEGDLGLFGGCDQLAISAAEVAVLSSWGLTLQHYAITMLFGPVSAQILYLAFGFLILRQQGAS